VKNTHSQFYKARAGKTPGSAEFSAVWKSDGAKSKKQRRHRNRGNDAHRNHGGHGARRRPTGPAAGRDCR
jgi:hypothetical protein